MAIAWGQKLHYHTSFSYKSFFVSVPLRWKKTQAFSSSQSPITHRKELILKKMLRNTLGYLLDLVIGYIPSLNITRLWELRTRDDLEKDAELQCCHLSLSSLNAKTDTLKIKQNCAAWVWIFHKTSWGTYYWLKHSNIQSARSC